MISAWPTAYHKCLAERGKRREYRGWGAKALSWDSRSRKSCSVPSIGRKTQEVRESIEDPPINYENRAVANPTPPSLTTPLPNALALDVCVILDRVSTRPWLETKAAQTRAQISGRSKLLSRLYKATAVSTHRREASSPYYGRNSGRHRCRGGGTEERVQACVRVRVRVHVIPRSTNDTNVKVHIDTPNDAGAALAVGADRVQLS